MQQFLRKCWAMQGLWTQANDQVPITPGSGGVGSNVATMRVASGANTVEYQVVMVADESGHVQDSLPTYYWQTPPIPAAANKVYLDLFNAVGSGKIIDIRGLWVQPNTTQAVTGTLGVRVDMLRSNTVGTGGSVAAFDAAAIDGAGGNIWRADIADAALPAQITARIAPTGGATSNAWLMHFDFFPEETDAGAHLTSGINFIPMLNFGKRVVLREGYGIKLVQGPVASVGNASFLIAFSAQ